MRDEGSRAQSQYRSDDMPGPSEAKTRKELIDPAPKTGWVECGRLEPGWSRDSCGRIRSGCLAGAPKKASTYPRRPAALPTTWRPPKGVSDYALYRPNGEVMAVVEAKRTSTDPRLAQTQAEFYVSEIAKRQSFAPFAFMTNGESTYFLEPGQAVKRRCRASSRPMTWRTGSSSARIGSLSPLSPSTRRSPTGPISRRRSVASARRSSGASAGR